MGAVVVIKSVIMINSYNLSGVILLSLAKAVDNLVPSDFKKDCYEIIFIPTKNSRY